MKKVLKVYLYKMHCKQVDTLILFDSVYCVLQNIIQMKIGKQVKIVSPISVIGPYLQKFLEDNSEIKKSLQKGSKHQFFVSDITNKTQALARQWFGSKIQLKEH